MSQTAQKQDVTDPAVVDAFAAKVRDERRLVALYLLTVADIRGTSPKVWNAWKGKLLEDLFHATRAALLTGTSEHTLRDSIAERQREAHRLLRLYAVPENAEQRLWRELDTLYLQRHTADEIAWHARHLYWRIEGTTPVVKVRLAREGAGLQALVYLPDQKALFARICGFFGRAGLSILEAKVHTTRHGYALDTFALLDPSNPNASYRETIQFIEYELTRALTEPGTAASRPPRAAFRDSCATFRSRRRSRSFPTTKARTSSSKSSPAIGPACSRASRTCWRRRTSTSPARGSIRWANVRKTCS